MDVAICTSVYMAKGTSAGLSPISSSPSPLYLLGSLIAPTAGATQTHPAVLPHATPSSPPGFSMFRLRDKGGKGGEERPEPRDCRHANAPHMQTCTHIQFHFPSTIKCDIEVSPDLPRPGDKNGDSQTYGKCTQSQAHTAHPDTLDESVQLTSICEYSCLVTISSLTVQYIHLPGPTQEVLRTRAHPSLPHNHASRRTRKVNRHSLRGQETLGSIPSTTRNRKGAESCCGGTWCFRGAFSSVQSRVIKAQDGREPAVDFLIHKRGTT